MQCPTCGEPYEALIEYGSAQPVAHLAQCDCSTPSGKTITYTQGHPLPSTVECRLCDDVFPEKMAEYVGGAPYCPECFNAPAPDPNELIADLLDLQEELRPTPRDEA